MVLSDFFLSKWIKNKYVVGLIAVVLSIVPLVFCLFRIEIYLALVLFDLLYFISKHLAMKEKIVIDDDKKEKKLNWDIIGDIIFLSLITYFNLMLIMAGPLWKLLPSAFYSCQFAWRLWSIVSLTVSWLFVIILVYVNKIKSRIPMTVMMFVPALLFGLSQAYPEKRLVFTYEPAQTAIVETFEEEKLLRVDNVGVMNEYIPSIFYDDNYVSKYEKSLYSKIKNTIGSHALYQYTVDEYLTPAFLEGSGTIVCTELNTPSVTFTASISEDNSLIQIPQFYYDGYEVKICSTSGEYVTNAEVVNVDSLVSFKANKGEYIIKVAYQGPIVRRVFNILFYVGLAGVVAITTLGLIDLYKEKKKLLYYENTIDRENG